VLHDDHHYEAPEDILGPDNDDRTVWGYPLDLADWQSFMIGHFPWRFAAETQTAYVARLAPAYPDRTTEEIAGWFAHASTIPA
jgi:hypothetical protein